LIFCGGGENRTPVQNRVMEIIYMLSLPIDFSFELISETKISTNQSVIISSQIHRQT